MATDQWKKSQAQTYKLVILFLNIKSQKGTQLTHIHILVFHLSPTSGFYFCEDLANF